MAEGRDPGEVWARCERVVGVPSPRDRDPRATLLALAERAPAVDEIDFYGGGHLAERLEARIAALLGKEAAVWMPSGTMAQQIALRIHAERHGNGRVAFHPHCHLEEHEERGFEELHGLHAHLLGTRERLLTAVDLDELGEPVAAVLLELPQRDLGGQLPAWDDLVAIRDKARERGAALHLDGARLWQCGPFYERALDEIAGLFDTVYVSFYKDLAAPAGAALAGPKDVIDEARIWQVRHGGRLYAAHPFLIAAERGLDEVLPRMPELVAHARELAAALSELDGVEIVPNPPQTAMFHVYLQGPLEPLQEAALDQTERNRTFLGFVRPTEVPGVQRVELTIGPASLEVPVGEAQALWKELLAARKQSASADQSLPQVLSSGRTPGSARSSRSARASARREKTDCAARVAFRDCGGSGREAAGRGVFTRGWDMSANRRRRTAPKQVTRGAPAATAGPLEKRINEEVTAGMKQRLGLGESEKIPAPIQHLVDSAARDVAENVVEIAVIREMEDVATRLARGSLDRSWGSKSPAAVSDVSLLQDAEQLAAKKKALEAAGFSSEEAMRILIAEVAGGHSQTQG